MDKEEYLEWANHPLTKKFHQFLKDYRQYLMEGWAEGSYNHQSMEVVAMRNSEAVGKALMLETLVKLDDRAISEFYKESKDVSAN
jgi:hypothetical protein